MCENSIWLKKLLLYVFPICSTLVCCKGSYDNFVTSSEEKHISSHKYHQIENAVVHRYLNDFDYSGFSGSRICDYAKETDYRMDWPASFLFYSSSLTDSVYFNVFSCWKDSLLLQGCLPMGQLSDLISDMQPEQALIYEVYDDKEKRKLIIKDTVALTGRCRMIKLSAGKNIRDLGGLRCKDGSVVQYGRIYRGAAFPLNIGKEDLYVLRTVLSIDAEIDIRSNEELHLDDDDISNNFDYSLIGDDIDYYHCALSLNDFLLSHIQFANIFHCIVNSLRANKAIYIHCAGGADRTGAVMMLLESILDVQDNDIAKDFEMTSFAPAYYDKNNYRYCSRCKTVLDYFASCGTEGETRNERVESFLRINGVSLSEINDFKRIMLTNSSHNN